MTLAEVAHGVEHVDGEAFEGPVHAGEAQHRVGVARRLVEQRLLGELADLGAHVLGELHRDLDVAGLVPALPGHVELQLERRLVAAVAGVEVPAGAAGALERLDLADEDAVHQLRGRRRATSASFGLKPPRRFSPRTRRVAGVEDDVLDPDALEPLVPGQLVDAAASASSTQTS